MRKRKINISFSLSVPERLYSLAIWPVLFCRKLRYGYAFRKIRLTQGQYAIVDPEDYYDLIQYKWCACKTRQGRFYARRGQTGKNKNNIPMHRQIMQSKLDAVRDLSAVALAKADTQYSVRNKLPRNLLIDHKNGNTLDNRKANLRIATPAQNAWNRRSTGRSSKYKGVHYFPNDGGYWRARITVNSKQISLGLYKDQISAAKSYDRAARQHYKEFAYLNFPNEN